VTLRDSLSLIGKKKTVNSPRKNNVYLHFTNILKIKLGYKQIFLSMRSFVDPFRGRFNILSKEVREMKTCQFSNTGQSITVNGQKPGAKFISFSLVHMFEIPKLTNFKYLILSSLESIQVVFR